MSYIPNPLIIPIGLLIGLLVALPIGPVNLLGLQRAVERGYFGGLAMGIGILLGDGLIALLAALGVNAIAGAIQDYRTAIQIIGGLALMVAGARLFYARPEFASRDAAARATLFDYVWDIPTAFFLTITNPGAVLGLIAMFGGVSTFVEVSSYIDAFTMAAAVMGGSFIYWAVVSRLISRVRHDLRRGLDRAHEPHRGLILFGLGAVFIGKWRSSNWRRGGGGIRRGCSQPNAASMQLLRVRLARGRDDLFGVAVFDDAATAHDQDAVRQRANDGEIMRDEDVSKAMAALQVAQEVNDLRLHGTVERGRRLIQHNEFRLQDHGAGNGDALALAAGELVRKAMARRRIELDFDEGALQRGDRARRASCRARGPAGLR